jgi:hypothetical protein
MIYVITHDKTSFLSSIEFDNINASCCSSCYNNYYINSFINGMSVYNRFYKNPKKFSKCLKFSDILENIKNILE